MTLHFQWLNAPRWMAHAHVIAVSTLLGVLRVLDVAVSGALVKRHAVSAAPAASVPTELLVTDPAAAGPRPVDTQDVPDAAVEAISL